MEPEIRQARAQTFDRIAAGYEAARPSYPVELIADLMEFGRLGTGSRVAEIGAGSGKATALLVAQGMQVTCIEPGANLASLLRAKFDSRAVQIVQSGFEDFSAAPESFDAVVAAQSAHWIRREVRYSHPHELLVSGGTIAFFWNMSPRTETPFFQDLHRLYDALADGLRDPTYMDVPADSITVAAGEVLFQSDLFRDVEVRRYPWQTSYTIDEYIALIDTHSNHQLLPAAQRAELYAAVRESGARWGGQVAKDYVTVAYLARKR